MSIKNKNVYDCTILGAGPAGLSAAIYAARAELDCLVVEKEMFAGGQILQSDKVDNYPGFTEITTFELAAKLEEHAMAQGVARLRDEVVGIAKDGDIFKITLKGSTVLSKSVVYALGSNHRVLGVDGESRLQKKGVSYCATCDGALYKGKTVCVIGGGNTALEDALYLARVCEKVYIVHRRDEFRAMKSLQTTVKATKNIEVLWNSQLKSINGSERVESVTLSNGSEIALSGVFIAIGLTANTALLADFDKSLLDENAFVIAGEECKTSVDGLFAAGDCRQKALRQIVTAAADGANAVHSAVKYLEKQ